MSPNKNGDELACGAARQLQRGALPVDPQHRRDHHGRRPEDQRGQPHGQAWEAPNLFVMGRLAIPRRTPPTIPPARSACLAYWTAEAITKKTIPEEALLCSCRRDVARVVTPRVCAIAPGEAFCTMVEQLTRRRSGRMP